MAIRPMKTDDADAVLDVLRTSFADLDARLGHPPDPPPADRAPGLRRITHLVQTDPGGAWVAEEDGEVVGGSLALVREGVWGLSLLAVLPDAQSGGHGSELLRASVAHGEGTRAGLILASEDSRALRAYWRVGFQLRPAFDALGKPDAALAIPSGVREGNWPDDAAIADAAARFVRGAAISRDIAPSLETGARLWIHRDGGYAVARAGAVSTVAAHDPAAARELLRAAVIGAGAGGKEVWVGFVDALQQWAFDELLELGFRLRPGGAVAVRGDVGPLHPFVPSGAYL